MQRLLSTFVLLFVFAGSSFAGSFTEEISVYQPMVCVFEFYGTVYNGDPAALSMYLEGAFVEKSVGSRSECDYQDTRTDASGNFSVPGAVEIVVFTFSKEGFTTDYAVNSGLSPEAPIIMTLYPE